MTRNKTTCSELNPAQSTRSKLTACPRKGQKFGIDVYGPQPKFAAASGFLTLAEQHVLVLTSFIKLIKLSQNLIKLLPNHIIV